MDDEKKKVFDGSSSKSIILNDLFQGNSTSTDYTKFIGKILKYSSLLLKNKKDINKEGGIKFLQESNILGITTNGYAYIAQEFNKEAKSVNVIVREDCSGSNFNHFISRFCFNSFSVADQYRKELEELKRLLYGKIKKEASRSVIQDHHRDYNYYEKLQFKFDKYIFNITVDPFVKITLHLSLFHNVGLRQFIIPIDYFYLIIEIYKLIPEIRFQFDTLIDLKGFEQIMIK